MTQTEELVTATTTLRQQLRDGFAKMGISEELLREWDGCKITPYNLKSYASARNRASDQEETEITPLREEELSVSDVLGCKPSKEPSIEEVLKAHDADHWTWVIKREIEKGVIRNTKRQELVTAGVAETALEEWDKLDIPLSTLEKLTIPTPDQLKEWESLPKGSSKSLAKICHPILCKWTVEEVIQAMRPAIEHFVTKYRTNRTDEDECRCLGIKGVFHALSTDAGIAPFLQHARMRARTSIRRESATSQIVKETEKRPSKTEVKREITAWLRGTFEEAECDRLASNEVNPFRSKIDYRNDHFQSFEDIQVALTQARLSGMEDAVTKECIKKCEAWLQDEVAQPMPKIHSIPLTAKANLEKLTKKNISVNTSQLVGAKDLVSQRVQKLGYSLPSTDESLAYKRKGVFTGFATMVFVREGFPLSKISVKQLNDLCDYLNQRFNPKTTKTPHLISAVTRSNLTTVADLVNAIAVPPDFQKMAKPVHAFMSDEVVEQHPKLKGGGPSNEVSPTYASASSPFADPRKKLESESNRQGFMEMMSTIRSRIALTPSQEMVMVESWGLDMSTAKDGSFVANNYGKLLLVHALRKQILAANASTEGELFTTEICSSPTFMKELKSALEQLSLPPDLAQGVAETIKSADLKKVSRQRITQYLKAISHKYKEALFDAHFINVPDPKRAINNVREGIQGQPSDRNPGRLTPEEDEILCWLYDLKGESYTFDEIAKDLDAIYPELWDKDAKPKAMKPTKGFSFEKKKAHLNEKVQGIKEKLLRAYY